MEGGGQLWPRWGIVNGQPDWDCGNRDASFFLLYHGVVGLHIHKFHG